MRRLLAAPLLFAAVAAVALTADPPPAAAQPAPQEETFPTADGVRLKGLFHKSPKGADRGNAVVVLMYAPGPDRSMTKPGDWGGLAQLLNDKGFHVFRFDWRGHGKSTDITDPAEFWTNRFSGPWNNKNVAGARAKPAKSELNAKADFRDRYFPAYVNDLAAVRTYLDQKNDQGDLNSSSIYLIGAGEAATLGMLWLAAEWNRPAVAPDRFGGFQYKFCPDPRIPADPPAGKDIAAAVWLSGSRPPTVADKAVANLVKGNLRLRDNNHMMFLYGEKDAAGAREAKFFFEEALVAKGNRQLGVKALEQSFSKAVPGSKLAGAGLLGQNKDLGTEDNIVKFLEARHNDRASLTRKERRYVAPYYIDLTYFGLRP